MTKPEITSCEDALRLLADFLDDELESAAGAELERHIAICRTCYSRVEFEKALKARITEGGVDVGAGLRSRIRTMIDRFGVSPGTD